MSGSDGSEVVEVSGSEGRVEEVVSYDSDGRSHEPRALSLQLDLIAVVRAYNDVEKY